MICHGDDVIVIMTIGFEVRDAEKSNDEGWRGIVLILGLITMS